jgi:hypothetical protein
LEALERHCQRGDIGRLDFRRGNFEGHIFLGGCRIIHAAIGDLSGIPALFMLFDWGDAETTWQSEVRPETPSLNLTMEEASALYAESLRDRAELALREKEKVDEVFSTPEQLLTQSGGIESILKSYTILLESKDPAVLPGGFILSDATKNSFVIGSAPDVDVVLFHASVEPQHCGLILERGSVLVWDLGAQSGVKINGLPIAQQVLRVGDNMTLGSVDVRVRFQIRRPTIKITRPADADAPKTPAGTEAAKVTAPLSKEVPKGPITFAKVEKELKKSSSGTSLFNKLGSIFGKKK